MVKMDDVDLLTGPRGQMRRESGSYEAFPYGNCEWLCVKDDTGFSYTNCLFSMYSSKNSNEIDN